MNSRREPPPCRRRLGFGARVLCLVLFGSACSPEPPSSAPSAPLATPEFAPFHEAQPGLGLDFEHANGATGKYYFCEIVGAGCALVDFDNDGDLDVFCVQGGPLEEVTSPDAVAPSHRLYENRRVDDGTLRFVDVTVRSGDLGHGYGMGVAAADYDNDGHVDLYVTRFGPNQLLRNNGNGTFTEVAQHAGVDVSRWSTSASFFDYDRDGHLDLFVCNYVDFTLRKNKDCYAESSARDYCGPLSYDPVPDCLFRNRGDGTFENTTVSSRIGQYFGAALGVIAVDLDRDGWLDLYVANDGTANQCWMNERDGTFRDDALLAGCAYDESGRAEASMGVEAADFDEDGDDDLFMTHLTGETNTFYRNNGRAHFEDTTVAQGLASPSRSFTGFGTGAIDFDRDGWLDIFAANGAVKAIGSLVRAGDPSPFHQTNQLFHNLGAGRFADVTRSAGAAFLRSEVSRGAAFGDLDNDGDTDIVVTNNDGPVRLLLGNAPNDRHWIGIRLVDPKMPVSPLGARVRVTLASGRTLWRWVRADGSYCSANDPRVLVGLDREPTVASVMVQWSNGSREQWAWPPVDAYSTFVRGQGEALP
ncbi:MAG: CRTAC1 family protein [Planctomycetota bacterium]